MALDQPLQVWESKTGPVLVESMDADWLRNAIRFVETHGFPNHWFPALAAMKARLMRLTGATVIAVPIEPATRARSHSSDEGA